MKRLILLAFILTVAGVGAADTFTFDGLSTTLNYGVLTPVTTGPFTINPTPSTLAPAGRFQVKTATNQCGLGGCNVNGGAVGVTARFIAPTNFTLWAGGAAFDLTSGDFAQTFLGTTNQHSTNVTVVGADKDGNALSVNFAINKSFQTIAFGWQNLDWVTFTGYGGTSNYFSFDNLQVSLTPVNNPQLPEARVPEPASLLLLGTGMGAIAAFRRRRV